MHDNNLVCLKLDYFWQVCSLPHSVSACLVWFAHSCRHDKSWESLASRQNPCLLRTSSLCVTSQSSLPHHQDTKEPESPFSTGSKMEKQYMTSHMLVLDLFHIPLFWLIWLKTKVVSIKPSDLVTISCLVEAGKYSPYCITYRRSRTQPGGVRQYRQSCLKKTPNNYKALVEYLQQSWWVDVTVF